MLFVLPLEATLSEACKLSQRSLQKYSVVILEIGCVLMLSEIWPEIQGQLCASVWQVRKHLSGQGHSVAQGSFKLMALGRRRLVR